MLLSEVFAEKGKTPSSPRRRPLCKGAYFVFVVAQFIGRFLKPPDKSGSYKFKANAFLLFAATFSSYAVLPPS
ncbi:MAG TPA: hypothetical protein QF772_02890 [Nitrospinaceae bacterium]|nr:hypothetical protein [Nitrospinaceae bacterium]